MSVVRIATTVPTATSIIRFSAEAMGGPRLGSPSTTMAAVTQAMRSEGRRAEKKPSTSTVTARPANLSSRASASATATRAADDDAEQAAEQTFGGKAERGADVRLGHQDGGHHRPEALRHAEGIDHQVGQARRDRGLDGKA